MNLSLLSTAFSLSLTGLSYGQSLDFRPSKEQLLDGNSYFGPYEATVLEVVDADTLKLAIDLWPGHVLTINVRSRGVDTPEIREAKCDTELKAAKDAKSSIERKFAPGRRVYLSDVVFDKYGSRVLGDIYRTDSDRLKSLSTELLETGMAVEYDGVGERKDWCGLESQGTN